MVVVRVCTYVFLSQGVQGRVINFTGVVPVDFDSRFSDVVVSVDPSSDVAFLHSANVLDPYSESVNAPTGWNMIDVRFAYDSASDTAFFGT